MVVITGTDPEFFLSRRGHPIPAFAVLASKDKTKNGLFWDGFQAETRVTPSFCHQTVVRNIANQLHNLSKLDCKIRPYTAWRIPDNLMDRCSDEFVAFGCDPSFNIYGTEARKVQDPRSFKWRFAGGHIHFSMTPAERQDKTLVKRKIKLLDAIAGVAAVALAQHWDNPIRRRYYGLAGEFRLPPHGLEWRTLSNFWVFHPQATNLILDLARAAFQANPRDVTLIPEKVIETINYSDARQARELLLLNREWYTTWATDRYDTAKPFWRAIKGGIEASITDFGKDVLGAWETVKDPWVQPLWRHLS